MNNGGCIALYLYKAKREIGKLEPPCLARKVC